MMRHAACDDCLRRAWLVDRLAPSIEVAARQAPVRELLSLDSAALRAAVREDGPDTREADATACRARLEAAGLWAVCRCDDRYPSGLRDAADAPWTLFGRGAPGLLELLEPERCVTIVGARRATSYGREAARQLASELACAGLCVVSGMAYGIDSCAHEGALESGGATVAVLGSGPDVPSPGGRTGLWRRISGHGLVLSERPPGGRPFRWSFPARNRIMAALSTITVVVEARRRSGSAITVDIAQDLGREVGAVPGPITSPASAGPNGLLSDGALVVCGAGDVLDRLGCESLVPSAGPSLSEPAARALAAVAAGAATPDAVIRASGLASGQAMAALSELELGGYVTDAGRGRVAATGRLPSAEEMPPDPHKP